MRKEEKSIIGSMFLSSAFVMILTQIIGLAARLMADGYSGFEGICTVDAMATQIEAARKAVTA